MRLKDYLYNEETGTRIAQKHFAKRIGSSTTTIQNYCHGSKRPALDTALKIQEATKGKVTIFDVLDEWKDYIKSDEARKAANLRKYCKKKNS